MLSDIFREDSQKITYSILYFL